MNTEPAAEVRRYFFRDGLRFECTGCGACCTGAPGRVRVTEEERDRLATRLKCTPDQFRERFMRVLDGEWVLTEKPGGDCVFYEQGCSVYDDRPQQCRTYPFWLCTLRTEADWRDAAKVCPGIGRGPLHSADSILRIVKDSPI